MNRFLCLSLLLLALSCGHSRLRTGDLLFVGPGEGSPMDEAIASSTGTWTHVALIEIDPSGTPWVIDATPRRGVGRYPLDTLLRENPGAEMLVKRLRDTTGVAGFVDQARRLIGRPYDFAFLPENGAWYCSELVHDTYRRPDGSFLFENKPMNFLASDGSLPAYWQSLFDNLGIPVPQGTPGSNPQDLSASPLLVTVPHPQTGHKMRTKRSY